MYCCITYTKIQTRTLLSFNNLPNESNIVFCAIYFLKLAYNLDNCQKVIIAIYGKFKYLCRCLQVEFFD